MGGRANRNGVGNSANGCLRGPCPPILQHQARSDRGVGGTPSPSCRLRTARVHRGPEYRRDGVEQHVHLLAGDRQRLRPTFVAVKSASALSLDECRPGSSDREEGEPREASDMRSPAPCPRLSPDRSGAPDCALFRGREFEKPSGAGRRPRRLPPARREQQSCRPLAPSIIGTSILIWSSAPHGESS